MVVARETSRWMRCWIAPTPPWPQCRLTSGTWVFSLPPRRRRLSCSSSSTERQTSACGSRVRPSRKYLSTMLENKRMMDALADLMPNVNGPNESKRSYLLTNVVHSVMFYGAPTWALYLRYNRRSGDSPVQGGHQKRWCVPYCVLWRCNGYRPYGSHRLYDNRALWGVWSQAAGNDDEGQPVGPQEITAERSLDGWRELR